MNFRFTIIAVVNIIIISIIETIDVILSVIVVIKDNVRLCYPAIKGEL